MSEAIIIAIITGCFSLFGIIYSVHASQTKTMALLDKQSALHDQRLKDLTAEVKRHNDFAERIPRLETRVDNLEHIVETKL